jgi:hypothetical protein
VLGSVRGMRTFRVRLDGRLASVNRPHVWSPGTNTAQCQTTEGECQGYVGHPRCTCGFYAYHDGSEGDAQGIVTGIIDGFGCATIGTKGFRVSKAKILALCLPYDADQIRAYTRRFRFWLALTFSCAFLMGMALSMSMFVIFGMTVFPSLLGLAPMVSMFSLVGAIRAYQKASRCRQQLFVSRAVPMAKIREIYPDAQIFNSVAEMLAAFPVRYWGDDDVAGLRSTA